MCSFCVKPHIAGAGIEITNFLPTVDAFHFLAVACLLKVTPNHTFSCRDYVEIRVVEGHDFEERSKKIKRKHRLEENCDKQLIFGKTSKQKTQIGEKL